MALTYKVVFYNGESLEKIYEEYSLNGKDAARVRASELALNPSYDLTYDSTGFGLSVFELDYDEWNIAIPSNQLQALEVFLQYTVFLPYIQGKRVCDYDELASLWECFSLLSPATVNFVQKNIASMEFQEWDWAYKSGIYGRGLTLGSIERYLKSWANIFRECMERQLYMHINIG